VGVGKKGEEEGETSVAKLACMFFELISTSSLIFKQKKNSFVLIIIGHKL